MLDESRRLRAEKYLDALDQLIQDLPDPFPLSDAARAELRRRILARDSYDNQVRTARAGFGYLPMGSETPFVLAMSGGGHRATLFGLGGLMAIVDAGANSRVRQIASVSGGSITNLVVAKECNFRNASPAEFGRVARELFDTVTRGVLTKVVLGVLVTLIFGPILAFVVAAVVGKLPSLPLLVAVTLLWLIAIFLRGLLIESLMAMRYFGHRRSRLRLKSLAPSQEPFSDNRTQDLDHVVCCTDLVSGRPVYFSNSMGGKAYGLVDKHTPESEQPIRDAADASVAAILRASAGFPGIPPRRFRIVGGSWFTSLIPLRRGGEVAFLSDGGIWNNLGTQAYVEDHFYQGRSERLTFTDPMAVLSIDASADPDKRRGWDLQIPGWAEIQALLRQITILSTNTVEPRRHAFRTRLRLAIARNDLLGITQPGGAYQMGVDYERRVILVSLSDFLPDLVADLHSQLLSIATELSDVRRAAAELAELPDKYDGDTSRAWDVLHKLSSRQNPCNRAIELLTCPAYPDLCSIAGFTAPTPLNLLDYRLHPNDESTSTLSDHGRLLRLIQRAVDDCLYSQEPTFGNGQRRQVPTTLGAVDKATAREVVGQGYANMAVTLFMLGLVDRLPSPREHHSWLFDD